MSNDPLARSDIWAGALNETEYDAVYASVTATDRGRWFLSEYANRNRHANTDLVVAAIARIESAIHGETGQNSANGATDRSPGIVAAVERISDIAIGLRERGADAALCDALDAAVREISGLDTAVQPHEAAVVPISEKASASAIDDEPLPEAAFFDMELQESKKFADAVAALAASLASPGGEPTESAGSQSETLEVVAPPHDFELKPEPESRTQIRAGPKRASGSVATLAHRGARLRVSFVASPGQHRRCGGARSVGGSGAVSSARATPGRSGRRPGGLVRFRTGSGRLHPDRCAGRRRHATAAAGCEVGDAPRAPPGERSARRHARPERG